MRMSKIIIATGLFAAMAGASAATSSQAFAIDAGLENFTWREFDGNGGKLLQEDGMRYRIGIQADHNLSGRKTGLNLGYRGSLYLGNIDYDGQTLDGTPVQTKTRYVGSTHEARVFERFAVGQSFLDASAGLTFDQWRRAIRNDSMGLDQIETYNSFATKLSVEATPQGNTGYIGAAFVRVPLRNNETAKTQDMGFDQDLKLRNGKKIGYGLSAGYKLSPQWSVVGYYEYQKLGQSNMVDASIQGTPIGQFLQPESDYRILGVKARYSF